MIYSITASAIFFLVERRGALIQAHFVLLFPGTPNGVVVKSGPDQLSPRRIQKANEEMDEFAAS